MKNAVKEIFSTILYILAVLLGTWLIITFVGQRTSVSGSSMEPTLHHGDQLIMDKLTYHFSEPERFDIIVFPFQYEDCRGKPCRSIRKEISISTERFWKRITGWKPSCPRGLRLSR